MTAEERREALRAFARNKRQHQCGRTLGVENRGNQPSASFFLLGMLGTLFAISSRHSGGAYGFDVCFTLTALKRWSDVAPSVIHVMVGAGRGIFLPIGVIVSRSTLIDR